MEDTNMSTTAGDTTLDATLDTAQAAALLQVEPDTLRHWRRRGVGPPYVRVTHNIIRYLPRHLEEWLAARTVVPEPKRRT
jgi:hypothetical protein